MTAMTSHERFSRMYRHQDADRVPVLDSPWHETIERWVREGMTTPDYIEYFDLDKTAYISTDNSPRLPVRVESCKAAPCRPSERMTGVSARHPMKLRTQLNV